MPAVKQRRRGGQRVEACGAKVAEDRVEREACSVEASTGSAWPASRKSRTAPRYFCTNHRAIHKENPLISAREKMARCFKTLDCLYPPALPLTALDVLVDEAGLAAHSQSFACASNARATAHLMGRERWASRAAKDGATRRANRGPFL